MSGHKPWSEIKHKSREGAPVKGQQAASEKQLTAPSLTPGEMRKQIAEVEKEEHRGDVHTRPAFAPDVKGRDVNGAR